MHTLGSKNSRPIQLFHELFGPYLCTDDYMEFYSNRRKAGKDTFLASDVCHADKLSTIVLEEYSVRGKLNGHVIVVWPDPAYDIPIFTFQLGGNETQSIALLDISPTRPDTDYAPLVPTFEKYRERLDIGASTIDWVTSICSPYLLHRQYGPLDHELFFEAAREYLSIWIDCYYQPGTKLSDPGDVENTTAAIHRYKQVLHDNDPAYGVFSKAWGKQVADAFVYLETRDHPALESWG